MITAPPRRRPVYQWLGYWQRRDDVIATDGRFVTWGGRLIQGLTDITAAAGGAALAGRVDGTLTVFDFSGSRLCRCQLYLATRNL